MNTEEKEALEARTKTDMRPLLPEQERMRQLMRDQAMAAEQHFIIDFLAHAIGAGVVLTVAGISQDEIVACIKDFVTTSHGE